MRLWYFQQILCEIQYQSLVDKPNGMRTLYILTYYFLHPQSILTDFILIQATSYTD